MSEFFVNIWIIQILLILFVQVFVFMAIRTNRANYWRFALMTMIFMVPGVGAVYVLFVAAQAFRPIPTNWAGEYSVFDSIAEGYEL